MPVDPNQIRDVVAMDGPSGAGKSTVARELARHLGFAYLDTGAMYRAVTWYLLEHQVSDELSDPRIAALVEHLDLVVDDAARVHANGSDISAHLRSHEVESRVSAVSALPVVRARMRELQRSVAARRPTVAEGRDMASVVFPAARWKLFLDAAPSERARRRHRDFLAAGRQVTEADVLEEITVRDRLDSTRHDAPLRRTPAASYFDTTGKSLEQVVRELVALIRASPA